MRRKKQVKYEGPIMEIDDLEDDVITLSGRDDGDDMGEDDFDDMFG